MKEKKISTWDGITVFIILLAIGYAIAIAFHASPYGRELVIQDYFNFTASFGGAILGSFMSLFIMKCTIRAQKEQFERERHKDRNDREYNEKVNLYNEIIALTSEMYESFHFCIHSLFEIMDMDWKENNYNHKIMNILASYVIKLDLTVFKINHKFILIDKDEEIYNEILNIKEEYIKLYCNYQYQTPEDLESTIDELDELKRRIESINEEISYKIKCLKK